MHFHYETVSARSYGCAGHGTDFIPDPRGMARVHYNRQVGKLLYDGNGGKVQSISRVALECANSALAQHNLVVAFRENVFGGHEPFLDSRRQSPLQKHRLADSANGLQQFEILHVSSPDLNNINVFHHQVGLARRGHLRNNTKPGLFPYLTEYLQPILSQTLERIGRGPRLECPAPEQHCPVFAHGARNVQSCLPVFNTAWTGDHYQAVPAYGDISDFYDGSSGMQFATHQLVRLGYGNGLFHPRQRFIICAFPVHLADNSQDSFFHPSYVLHHMALGTKYIFEPFNFFLCCPFSEYENHGKSSGHILELTAIKKPRRKLLGA